MKRSILVLALAAAPLLAGSLNQGQRDFALSSLHASRKAFLDSIAGLSAAQWKFKPGPDRWSIAEVAEHVILTEDLLFGLEQKTLQSPAVADRKDDRTADQALLDRMADRSQKRKNPPELGPTGRFATPRDAAQAFKEKRDHTLDYVRTTADDLRAHVTKGPAGEMDAYQVLLMIAGHTNRHVLQIQEVKAAAGFPGK
jgi:hypothetical protein